MPRWRVFLIQLLNIAGTGPIFGAILGAAFGPVAFSVDHAGRHLHGCNARLPVGRHARAQRRPEHPRSGRTLPGHRNAAIHAPLLGRAARTRRCGLPAQSRRHPQRHGAFGAAHGVGLADSGLLLRRHAAAHRQDHRQDLSDLRRGPHPHGARTAGRAALRPLPDPRTDDAGQRTARPALRADRPDALHHHRVRSHFGLSRHAVAADGPLRA